MSYLPVPGQAVGSIPSISKVKYTGLAPICSRTDSMSGAIDLYQH